MADFIISELPIPASLDAPGGADFARAIELNNAVIADGYGTDELNYTPAEELPYYQDVRQPRRMLLAHIGDELVGVGTFETQTSENSDAAWLLVQVLPQHRGRGIGTALSDALEQIARESARPKALVYTPIRPSPGAQIDSPTGFGSVPASDPAVRFLTGRGYRLEQIERASRLQLPVQDLDDRLAAAQDAGGPDYRTVYWVAPVPDRWLDDIALLATRMSTDAPSAGLEEPEDIWTAERIVEADKRLLASPRRRVSVAIEHVPTGRLVAFSDLSVPPERSRSVAQYATLVLREHRGHQLGMLMKAANLAHLERVYPGHPSVITFNAEENRHMLSVNESMGFEPIASESAWRKDLA